MFRPALESDGGPSDLPRDPILRRHYDLPLLLYGKYTTVDYVAGTHHDDAFQMYGSCLLYVSRHDCAVYKCAWTIHLYTHVELILCRDREPRSIQ